MTQTLLRRTAEALYSTGRHLERAEDIARIVLVHCDTHVDLPVGEDVGWGPLLSITGLERDFAESHPALAQRSPRSPGANAPPESEVVEFLLASPMNSASLLATVSHAREALRSARAAVPREAWELTNGLWLAMREHRREIARREGRVQWLRRVIAGCERINGTFWGSMHRDSATALTRIGQHLERASLTCTFLAVRAESALDHGQGDAYDHVRAMSLLRSLGAYHQYRRAMPVRPDRSVVEFMLQDEAFSRAVVGCLAQVREHLKELPRNDEPLAACADASVLASGTLLAGMSTADLRSFLADLGGHVVAIHQSIESALFTEPPSGASPTSTRHDPARTDRGVGPVVIRRYHIEHQTTYRYDAPAEESHNETHLRPRNTVGQRVLTNSITIKPRPVNRSDFVDLLGNHVTSFVVRGGFEEMVVSSISDVELFSTPEPPTGAPWESVCVTLDRDHRLDTRAAKAFRSPSRLVPNAAELGAYAKESFDPHRPIVEAVRELCSRIHRDFVYQPGFTSVTTPLLEVFQARRGVCQDFAHLAIGCLRAVGLAARYVSGYIETFRPVGDQLTGADASHAWASTYLPGWGWLDLDPTNDLIVCHEHVTTAWGRDYHDVSPLRGSVIGGGQAHTLDVAVEVRRLETGA